MNENQGVDELAAILECRGFRVWKRKRVYAWAESRTLPVTLGYEPVLRPEVDLIVRKNGFLNAIEVKHLDARESSFGPFFHGVGQTLSLLEFGFDHAALWFVFTGKDENKINQYGAWTWSHVRNMLKLPIEFTFLVRRETGVHPTYEVRQYTSRTKALPLQHLHDPAFPITWKHRNPLVDERSALAIRTVINSKLGL